MRSEYINANKWHSRACTQFIHTLDTENDVLHTMNVHCVQTYEEFSIYAISGKCHIHSPVIVVFVLWIQLKVIVLVDVFWFILEDSLKLIVGCSEFRPFIAYFHQIDSI